MKENKAVMNSDVVNDEYSIYYSFDDNYFELFKQDINGTLIDAIWMAIKKCESIKGFAPDLLIIPFAQYNNFIVDKDNLFPGFEMQSLSYIIKQTTRYDIKIIVMVPDYLKEKVKPC